MAQGIIQDPQAGMMGANPAPEMPVDPAAVAEVPMEQMAVEETAIEGAAEQMPMDEDKANEVANKMILSAKDRMYGEQFDKLMEVMQNSQNLVEDIALIGTQLISTDMSAIHSTGQQVPYDYVMDVSAEIVGELYDMAVETGVYQPSSEEEVARNQNISLTMVAGELGKDMSESDALPVDGVEAFMDEVGGDGFMLSPIYCPGAIEEFVDLVVPELQRRGLFRNCLLYTSPSPRD